MFNTNTAIIVTIKQAYKTPADSQFLFWYIIINKTSMETQKSAPFHLIVITSLILVLIGWGGLAALLLYTLPTLGPRWLFFFLLMVALSGTVLPVVYFLNRRFPSTVPANGPVLVRQSMWVGIYGDIIAWLVMGRVFNSARGLFLAVGFIIIEILLRMSEQSRWKPKE